MRTCGIRKTLPARAANDRRPLRSGPHPVPLRIPPTPVPSHLPYRNMLQENLIKIYEKSFRENREMSALTDYFKNETF